jgi:hypothetical protein
MIILIFVKYYQITYALKWIENGFFIFSDKQSENEM